MKVLLSIATIFINISTVAPHGCLNVPFFKDAEGDDCEWYSEDMPDDDHYQTYHKHYYHDGKLDR